jgi:non-ribosomal peptide synthetase component F
MLEQLCRVQGAADQLRSLRYVVSSGDVLRHAYQVRNVLHPDAVLLSIYGSSETTADAMFAVIPSDASALPTIIDCDL